MQLVDGAFCPRVEQVCLDHPEEPRGEADNSDRCNEFASPTRCLSDQRTLMRFCVDTFEWPNRAREKPRVLTSWKQAQQMCASLGKRLCDEDEWLFACEGELMLPYVYGYRRDPTVCVVDRLYQERTWNLKPYEACLGSPACAAAFAKLDQREPAGSFRKCVSSFGAFDMNGNANEWVNVPGATYPHRSGIKGGWWGPVRGRCRPTVRFHKEEDWGYEVGFRCCKAAYP